MRIRRNDRRVGLGLLASACVLMQSVALIAAAQDRQSGEQDRGQAVYEYWCATCHAEGPGMPGTQALQAKYKGNPSAVLVDRQDLTAASIAVFVRNGVSVMPSFRKTEITDADLAALSNYIVAMASSN